ncbi:AAA family ATPase [Pseudomonas thivervalensis]|uniref:AAA family ATPase n=1 Tax=Pseudomonas thivervalensis TaxID=86265 RepID=UPI003D9644BF
MIIHKFYAKGVHDIFNFKLNFHSDVNFLIGINGSGKTSALQLLEAALSFDLAALIGIKFSNLMVDLTGDSGRFILEIDSSPERIAILLNDESIYFDNARIFGEDVIGRRTSPSMAEFIENHRLEMIRKAGPLTQKFLAQRRPLFLGLERKISGSDDYTQWNPYRESHGRIISRGTKELLEGLDSCQKIIERAYTRYRRASDSRIDRLSTVILESTFEYFEFDIEKLNEAKLNPYEDLQELHNRRAEIEKFVKDLGGSDKAITQISEFFSKMALVVNRPGGRDPGEGWSLEWFMNMAQIKRIRAILSEIDRQKKMAERHYAPIKEFLMVVNRFFQPSKKDIVVDAVGKLKVLQGGKFIDLENLSSGEKQLIILLVHSRFGSTKTNSFVIDEPELSLHMRWQEMLVDALTENNKVNQFIFATHSPEIVGLLKDKCIRI